MLSEAGARRTALAPVALGEPAPADHLLHKIDAAVDFSLIQERTAALYCLTKRRRLGGKMSGVSPLFDILNGHRTIDIASSRITERNAYGRQADFLQAQGISMPHEVDSKNIALTRQTYKIIAEESVKITVGDLQKDAWNNNAKINKYNAGINLRNKPTVDYNNQMRSSGHPELVIPLPYKTQPRQPIPTYTRPGDL